jgi:hypothetical protein
VDNSPVIHSPDTIFARCCVQGWQFAAIPGVVHRRPLRNKDLRMGGLVPRRGEHLRYGRYGAHESSLALVWYRCAGRLMHLRCPLLVLDRGLWLGRPSLSGPDLVERRVRSMFTATALVRHRGGAGGSRRPGLVFHRVSSATGCPTGPHPCLRARGANASRTPLAPTSLAPRESGHGAVPGPAVAGDSFSRHGLLRPCI